jgi:hypothetical protein
VTKFNRRAQVRHYITQSTPRSSTAQYFRAHHQRASDVGGEINPDYPLHRRQELRLQMEQRRICSMGVVDALRLSTLQVSS